MTGGIGSGKSLLCRIFSILGTPVYNADQRAKNLMAEDRQLHAMLRDIFGPDIIRPEGPDKKALAGIIFNNPAALKKVNEIVHPRVLTDFMNWCGDQQDAPYVVKEAAILFESGMHFYLDTVILVTAPEELRLQRVMNRDGEPEESIRKRMANQWRDEKKIPLAGIILENDNIRPLLPVILRLHSEFNRGEIPVD